MSRMPEGPEKNEHKEEIKVKEEVKERIIYVDRVVEVEKKEAPEQKIYTNPSKEWVKNLGNQMLDLVIERKNKRPMQEYTESNKFFIKLVVKWKWHFLAVTGLAILAAFLFSSEWFIKPKYRSTA